jgi:hypothetical protein
MGGSDKSVSRGRVSVDSYVKLDSVDLFGVPALVCRGGFVPMKDRQRRILGRSVVPAKAKRSHCGDVVALFAIVPVTPEFKRYSFGYLVRGAGVGKVGHGSGSYSLEVINRSHAVACIVSNTVLMLVPSLLKLPGGRGSQVVAIGRILEF